MVLFGLKTKASQKSQVSKNLERFVCDFSIEVMPRTAEKIEDFRDLLIPRRENQFSPSRTPGLSCQTHISYRPDRAPPLLVVATFMISLSLERTFPSCWGVVPCLIVVFTCSSISVVFASPLECRNFLIFCLSLVVLIFLLLLNGLFTLMMSYPLFSCPF